jgi:hypothetical protein
MVDAHSHNEYELLVETQPVTVATATHTISWPSEVSPGYTRMTLRKSAVVGMAASPPPPLLRVSLDQPQVWNNANNSNEVVIPIVDASASQAYFSDFIPPLLLAQYDRQDHTFKIKAHRPEQRLHLHNHLSGAEVTATGLYLWITLHYD